MTAHRSFYRSRAFKVLLAMYLLSYLLFVPLADELAEKVREAHLLRFGPLVTETDHERQSPSGPGGGQFPAFEGGPTASEASPVSRKTVLSPLLSCCLAWTSVALKVTNFRRSAFFHTRYDLIHI